MLQNHDPCSVQLLFFAHFDTSMALRPRFVPPPPHPSSLASPFFLGPVAPPSLPSYFLPSDFTQSELSPPPLYLVLPVEEMFHLLMSVWVYSVNPFPA